MKLLVMSGRQADDMLTLGCCGEEFVDAMSEIDIPDGCSLAVVFYGSPNTGGEVTVVQDVKL